MVSASTVTAHLNDQVSRGLFPGCSFAYGDAERTVTGAVGHSGPGSSGHPVTTSTPYDLASLTKVLATTPVAESALQQGMVSTDTEVREVCPEFGHEGVRVGHLLTHESGLPAYLPEENWTGDAERLWQTVSQVGLESVPGSRTVYSCLGFIVLQRVLETVFEKPLDAVVSEGASAIPGYKATFPAMLGCPGAPPTATCEDWRVPILAERGLRLCDGLVRGIVHDPLAFCLGGVSGNAGLFGSALDVAAFAQAALQQWGETAPWPSPVRPGGRARGWDVKDPAGSSAGSRFSPQSFGHTGFTGTSLWFDPDRGFFAALLSNAVLSGSDRDQLRCVRSAFADLALQDFLDNS